MYGIGAAGGDWSGALTASIRVPWANFNLRKIPAEIDPVSIASGSDNLVDGLRAVDTQLAARPGASVLIAGAGSIPLYAALCALHLGAGKVSLASTDSFALEVADSLGIECLPVTLWPKRFDTHDITHDCTVSPEGLSAVIKSTAPYGFCTSSSIFFSSPIPVPMLDMNMKGIQFTTGRANSASQLDRMLEIVGEGLAPERIKPAIVPMTDAAEAFDSVPFSQKLIFTR
jgi:alcohol dehydrogenase